MGGPLAVRRGTATAETLAAWSRAALDLPLDGPELWVHEVSTRALVLGAFEREERGERGTPLVRRGSGGPGVLVGPGTVHVALALTHPAELVACEPGKLVNRYVRPLLRALTRLGATAHYFGRDWVSVRHRPAAWMGFAHDAASRRSLVEAFVAVSTPFATARPSFLGKEPGTLESITGRSIAGMRIVDGIVDGYARAYDREPVVLAKPLDIDVASRAPSNDPPWRATAEEAVGELGAGPDGEGVFRLGGALLASRDAVAQAEARAAAIGPDEREIGRMVNDVFTAPGVALDGVRSLETVRDLLVRALS
jgi:hypothetical protein